MTGFDLVFSRQTETNVASVRVLADEFLDFAERNHLVVSAVIQVAMHGSRHDEQFFVIAFEQFERVFAHVSRVRVFAVNKQHCASNFAGICEKSLVFISEVPAVAFHPRLLFSERG